MARRVILSELARDDRRRILEYFGRRNQSKAYSKKLNEQFSQALRLISSYPQIGKLTDDKNLRVKIVSTI
jgi:toxin YoeB